MSKSFTIEEVAAHNTPGMLSRQSKMYLNPDLTIILSIR